MNKLLTKYQALADKAELSKGTMGSKQAFLKLVMAQPAIKNINSVTSKLEVLSSVKPGMLITFEYQPKYADKMLYWDRYPLVYVTQVNQDGWYGFNLHYLHPKLRARLFYDLEKKGVPIIDNDIAKLCIKRYLSGHVARAPRLFTKDLWEIAVQLPFEDFQKRGSQYVWKKTATVSKKR